jgi:phage gpG-like protein
MNIDGFGSMAAHLVRVAALGEEVAHHVTKVGAEAIEKDAKSRIGSYQDGGGGFPAWANLAESTVADRLRKGFTPDDPLLRTGELRDSIRHQVRGTTASIGTPDIVALYQEQGTSKIPPRPFLGPAGWNSRHTLGPVAARTVIAWLSGVGFKAPKINLSDL